MFEHHDASDESKGEFNTLWADDHAKAVKLDAVAKKSSTGSYVGWPGTFEPLTIAEDPT